MEQVLSGEDRAIANKGDWWLCAAALSNDAMSTTTVVATMRKEICLPHKAVNQEGLEIQVSLEHAVRQAHSTRRRGAGVRQQDAGSIW